jgi:hypothetical protein
MKCNKCGRENASYIEICPKCGCEMTTKLGFKEASPKQFAKGLDNIQVIAILSLIFGCGSIFLLPIIFGPAAIICGSIAVSKGNKLGWGGVILGSIGIIGAVLIYGFDNFFKNTNKMRGFIQA